MDLNKFYSVINEIENHGGLGMRAPGGTCRMLYGLAKSMNIKNYVDIGTFVGLSCLWVARAMEENNSDGRVYTVELDKKWLCMAKAYAMATGLAHRIEFILGDSRIVLPELKIKTVDLVLLDSGDKDLYQRDFENLENKFHEKTIIIAHDTMLQKYLPFHGAEKFRNYINNRKEYDVFQIEYEYGITLIKKRV